MIDYDEFQAEVRRLKRERWAKILAAEPPRRAPGRRPRDPEQERLLLRMEPRPPAAGATFLVGGAAECGLTNRAGR